jgi:hypothetical protein
VPAVTANRSPADATITRGPSAKLSGQATQPSVLSCTAGVFQAPILTDEPVGPYPAFSPLPGHIHGKPGGIFSVTLSVISRLAPENARPFGRHAALWCSDFPLQERVLSRSDRQPRAKIAPNGPGANKMPRMPPYQRRVAGNGCRSARHREIPAAGSSSGVVDLVCVFCGSAAPSVPPWHRVSG